MPSEIKTSNSNRITLRHHQVLSGFNVLYLLLRTGTKTRRTQENCSKNLGLDWQEFLVSL